MKSRSIITVLILATLLMVSCSKQEGPVREAISHKDDYQAGLHLRLPHDRGL